MSTRPVSIPHLVFGLIFLGAAGLWAIGAGTDADTSDPAVLAPAVLLGAGVIGLVGIVVNARRRDVRPESFDPYADIGVAEQEQAQQEEAQQEEAR